jgi:hypothetical protein
MLVMRRKNGYRFVIAGSEYAPHFQTSAVGSFTTIIQQDIDRKHPHHLLHPRIISPTSSKSSSECSSSTLPPSLHSPTALSLPTSPPRYGSEKEVYQVKLSRAFSETYSKQMVDGQSTAVVQQRLIPSKPNGMWGMELLIGVVEIVPPWGDTRLILFKELITMLALSEPA